MTPHRCPVCEGHGFVSPGFYNLFGVASNLNGEVCRTCFGKGVIWEQESEEVSWAKKL